MASNAAAPNVFVAAHDEWRIIWPDGVVDGPFADRREIQDFVRHFDPTGVRVQKRAVVIRATEWADERTYLPAVSAPSDGGSE